MSCHAVFAIMISSSHERHSSGTRRLSHHDVATAPPAAPLVCSQLERGREPNVSASVKHQTISKGLKYCLATGNWGVAKTGAAPKTGVSQVRRADTAGTGNLAHVLIVSSRYS